MQPGSEIAFGAEAVFDANTIGRNSAAMLTATTFVVAWVDGDSLDHGYACVGSIAGTTVTYGDKTEFETGGTVVTISVCHIDSTHVVIAYHVSSDGGRALVATITGDEISMGDKYTFDANTGGYTDATMLDSTHVAISYAYSTTAGKAVVGVITDTVIAFGLTYQFSAARIYDNAISALDSTHFVIAWEAYTTLESIIGVVSDDDEIAYGLQEELYGSTVNTVDVAALDSTHFVACYCDSNLGYKFGFARVGSVSVTTITYGTQVAFSTATTYYVYVTKYDESTFLLSYERDSETAGCFQFGHVDDTKITLEEGHAFDYNPSAGQTNYNCPIVLSSSLCLVTYKDDSNSQRGTACAGIITDGAVLLTPGFTTCGDCSSFSADPYDDVDWTDANLLCNVGFFSDWFCNGYDKYSYVLEGHNYGFAIPDGSTINGISVQIYWYTNSTFNVIDKLLQLTKDGLATVGDNKAKNRNLPRSAAISYFGGSDDLWGTTWTPAEINDSTFGVFFAAFSQDNNISLYVKYTQIIVYYTEGGAATASVGSSMVSKLISARVI